MPTRYVGLGKEASYGEDVAVTQYISAIDESFSEDNQIISEEEMGQRGMNKPMPGAFKPDGGFKFYAEPENIGLLLYALCGGETPTDLTGGEYRHDFTPTDVAKYLTAAVGTDLAGARKTYPGYAVKKMKFSLSPNNKLLVEVDGFGKTFNLDALDTPSFSALDPFVFHQGDVKIATTPNTDVQAMTIEIENMWEEDGYTIGSRLRRRANLQGLSVKGTMDILFETLTELELFLGKAAQTAPLEDEQFTKQQLDLDIDSHVLIAAATNYQLNFEFKEVLYNTNKANISKQDRTIQNLEWEAYVPTSGDQFKIELFNSVASY